ncbi:MAG: hypothetical protein K0S76_945, partial [Herbinix sp.]|nr:hypothetical protein [Herbinix sp.]
KKLKVHSVTIDYNKVEIERRVLMYLVLNTSYK